MKKIGQFLVRAALVLLILVLLAGAAGAFYLKRTIPNRIAARSFPQVDGENRAVGLEGPVDIYRDQMGVPHIYAASLHDLFFAQGYVHAQDRFWQMDFWRHIGSGRLSEMFGEGQVETDMFLRTLGWRQIAEAEYAALGPESKAILDAYCAGVNAYIKDREPVELSLEYLILTKALNPDYAIEAWTPIHSLTWGKAMAWDLGGNMDNEIERAILLKSLSQQQVDELFPPYPQDLPVIVPTIGEYASKSVSQVARIDLDFQGSALPLEAVAERLALLDSVLGPSGPGVGSNSWAVSGKLTASGAPLLANDMHLGIQMPSIWYQNALHCQPKSETCPFEVTGFSFPSVPGVVAGHNDKIAWGYTNVGPDVMDLYIEKVNPENPNQYEANGQWVDFETRQETILTGGEPVEITVRISRHGPIISDTYGSLKDEVDPKDTQALPFKDQSGVELPASYAIALAWTALQPSTPFEAIWGFNKAQNWDEFRASAQKFHVPAQNLLYADMAGNIGYQMPGDIPIRANGDGTLPVPGWSDEYAWTGFISFDELPYAFNPASGYIVTANNQVHPRGYPHLITKDWTYGFRANRIVEMIENAPGKINISYFQEMHADARNVNAESLLPILLDVELDDDLFTVREELLASWDLRNSADSRSAALFEHFWVQLLDETFHDDLPEAYWPAGGSRWYEVMRRLVEQPESAWWDDQGSEGSLETRNDIFARAFAQAVAQMQDSYGKDPAQWPTWGEVHGADFRNQTLGESGIAPIETLFNRGPFATGGGEELVNAAGYSASAPFVVDWLPSEREIVDLGNLDNSLAIHTTGQSGHAFHPHYDDMSPMWAAVQYAPMWWEQQSVIEDAEGHLRLLP